MATVGHVLLCWVGKADLDAAEKGTATASGPIGNALAARKFDAVVLLNNYKVSVDAFVSWLGKFTGAPISVRREQLVSPTDYADIYRAAMSVVASVLEEHGKQVQLTYHLSPGTPAMAAVWIIIAKTQFPAKLIEASKEKGVQDVDVPFELAAEFVPKVIRQAELGLERMDEGLRPAAPEFSDIIHRSETMKTLLERAQRAALFSRPVLILGESGTGKEILAAAIHRASPRAKKPYVVVNCGAIPKELVESEFFGHTRGAFTGATERRGHFEEADGGTLFLDEVGELPLPAQVKLLRVLQSKRVVRVGSSKEISVDVRIIAATNRDLRLEVAEGRFREDLFFRLAILLLHLPPIRDRKGDLGLIIDAVLEKLNEDGGGTPSLKKKLSPAARNLLLRHPWPGNVRELEGVLIRATAWGCGHVIDAADVRDALLFWKTEDEDVLHRPLGNGFDIEEQLAIVARHYLKRALEESAGTKTKAAALVGLPSYQTLKNWLARYNVEE